MLYEVITTGLQNGGDPFADADIGCVTEGEECIGDHDRTGNTRTIRFDLGINGLFLGFVPFTLPTL